MAFASSSSSVSALRTAGASVNARCLSKPMSAAAVIRPKVKSPRASKRSCVQEQARQYSATAAAIAEPLTPTTTYDPSLASAPLSRSPRQSPSSPTAVTPSAAQAYLTDLLALPSDRQFSPSLSLQMLTHKSYRYAHPVRHHPSSSSSSFSQIQPPPPQDEQSSIASHNGRLSFLGRRALSTYLALFIHDAFAGSSSTLKETGSDFLRGKGLEQRLSDLRHVNNLGRVVGKPWEILDMLRWDQNETSTAGGSLRVKGMAIEAILGGIFTQFGSPAAHRAFHLHILPHFGNQLRDPRLVERIEGIKEGLTKDFGRGILSSRQ